MSKREIIYLGFYEIPQYGVKRYSVQSSIQKMNYFADAMVRVGYKVHIISTAWLVHSDCFFKFDTKKSIQISENIKVTYCPGIKSKVNYFRFINRYLCKIWLLVWLIINTRRQSALLVYHSLYYTKLLKIAKSIRKFKLVLEVEEIYTKVWNAYSRYHLKEMRFFETPDSFITVSDIMANTLGKKTQAVIYGSYIINNKSKVKNLGLNHFINIVYAGSIDSTKGGAINAVLTAEHLPENYIMHILGTGTSNHIHQIKTEIQRINKKKKKEICIYQGLKTGKALDAFMNKCQIALNPQHTGKYMDTAFPSKIVFYLSHHLTVVSTKIKSIENSPFVSLIEFSRDSKPESISEAIINARRIDPLLINNLFRKLDNEFVDKLKRIFNKI